MNHQFSAVTCSFSVHVVGLTTLPEQTKSLYNRQDTLTCGTCGVPPGSVLGPRKLNPYVHEFIKRRLNTSVLQWVDELCKNTWRKSPCEHMNSELSPPCTEYHCDCLLSVFRLRSSENAVYVTVWVPLSVSFCCKLQICLHLSELGVKADGDAVKLSDWFLRLSQQTVTFSVRTLDTSKTNPLTSKGFLVWRADLVLFSNKEVLWSRCFVI